MLCTVYRPVPPLGVTLFRFSRLIFRVQGFPVECTLQRSGRFLFVIFVMVLSLYFVLLCTLICLYYALFSPWFGSPLRAWLAMCLSGVSFEFSLHSRVALLVRVWGLPPWESVAFSPALPPLIFLFFLGFLGEASACKVFTKRWVAHLMWFLCLLLFWSVVVSCCGVPALGAGSVRLC